MFTNKKFLIIVILVGLLVVIQFSAYSGYAQTITNPIDLVYSTFIGGSYGDAVISLDIDTEGYIYIVGKTESPNMPVSVDAYDTTFNGYQDVYAAKFTPDGKQLVYGTYIGGTDWECSSACRGVVDNDGNLIIVGNTHSNNFPITSGSFDTSYAGGTQGDGFILKLDSTGANLLFSTFIGSGGSEELDAVTIDGSGNIYTSGWTSSTDFPVTQGSFDTSFNGYRDIYVSVVNSSGSELLFSTFLGGNNMENPHIIDTDSNGDIYLVGSVCSSDFPTTINAFDISYNGTTNAYHCDGFVSKLSPDLSNLT